MTQDSVHSPTFRGVRGEYRIEGVLLSATGPAAVYRGREIDNGRSVAIKLAALAAPDASDALRREIAILRRLEHPQIVRIVDHGEFEGLPWYATELVAGETLREIWAMPGAMVPANTARWLALLQKFCAALGYMHEQGVVHRDLKPSNIAVRRADGQPIMLDLGAGGHWRARGGRERITADSAWVGTPEYLAPEQAIGGDVDARADMYSLGCMIYQAVTGSPPFTGDPAEVVSRHITEPVAPPSASRADVPPALDRLVMQLLDKNPARRTGYAADVALSLAELTGVAAEGFGEGGYLYRPSFVGRVEPRRAVVERFGKFESQRGSCAFVGGESGSGKTRFATEMAREAASRGFRVITGECVAFEGQTAGAQIGRRPLAPLGSFMRAICDLCVAGGPGTTERLLGDSAKVLVSYEPAIRSVPGYTQIASTIPLSPAAERERALRHLAEVTVRLANVAPLLLVIDDLQWADEMTLAYVETFRTFVRPRANVVLIGCYRTEETTEHLAALLRNSAADTIVLNRLNGDEVATMVSDMLAIPTPPHALVETLQRHSEGNPFYVSEYLRVSMQTGMLRRSPQGQWTAQPAANYDALPLPASIEALIDRQLSGLGPLAAKILSVGSALGREFSLDDSCLILGIDWADATAAIAELFKRQILEQAQAERVAFVHDKLRDGAYQRFTRDEARHIHRAAAEMLESRIRTGGPLADRLLELGHHWEQAGALDRAAAYLGEAADLALRSGAYNDAARVLLRAVKLDDAAGGAADRLARARWERMLGVAKFAVGELNESIVHTSRALSGLGQSVPGSSLGWLGLIGSELVRSAVPRRHSATRSNRALLLEVSQACGQIAISHFYNADGLATVANLLRALDRAEMAGHHAMVADAACRLGYVLGTMRLYVLAERLFARAHSRAAASDAPLTRGTVLYMEAMYREIRGEWAECRSLGREAAAILQATGDETETETAQAIASHGYFFAGRYDQALDLSLAILDAAERRGNRHHIAWGLYLAARCEVALGLVDQPITRMLRAQEFLGELPDAIDILICDGWLARAFLLRGELDRACEFADRIASLVGHGKRPAVPQCADGFAAWAEVTLARRRADPTSRAARLASAKALRELQTFALLFPIARPAARRCRGDVAWLAGRRARAARHWRAAAASARRYQMPYEEDRANERLAEL